MYEPAPHRPALERALEQELVILASSEAQVYDAARPESEEAARQALDTMLLEAFGYEPSEAEAARYLAELVRTPEGAPPPDPTRWPEDWHGGA